MCMTAQAVVHDVPLVPVSGGWVASFSELGADTLAGGFSSFIFDTSVLAPGLHDFALVFSGINVDISGGVIIAAPDLSVVDAFVVPIPGDGSVSYVFAGIQGLFSAPGDGSPSSFELSLFGAPTSALSGLSGTFTVTQVPEPPPAALVLAGTGVLLLVVRRRQHAAGKA